MTGTFVNVGAIVAGSLVGLLLKRGIPEKITDSLLKAVGLVVLIVGFNGVLIAMMSVGLDGRLREEGVLLLLISLAVGCLVGELLKIEDRLNGLGGIMERRLKSDNFAKGFVTASLVFVIGAMSVIGALNDGLSGDSTILFTKAIMDGITAIVLTTALGIGVMFSAVSVFIVQGAISLLARLIAPYVSDDLIRMFSMVGFAIVMAIGFNFLTDAKIRIANLLPALVIPVIYYYVFYGNIIA
ncbi:MAG: DUF554 domain-containing protein [Clostridiales bacterium]|nr:DUF554 domain-containing protein [Clostridiales bacterium]